MIDPSDQEPTDDELMAAMARGDEDALAALIARWQRPLHRFVYRGVRDADIAEDLTQETFWRVWRARERYRPEGKFCAFLFRTAARLALDHHRRRPRQRTEGDEALATAPAPIAYHADQGAREAELAEALERAVDRLPPNQRMALELGRMENLSYKEIADILDCTVGAVEQLVFRARTALRVELHEFIAPPGTPRKAVAGRAGRRNKS